MTTRAAFYRELDLAIERAGGSAHIRACGRVRASRLQASAVAWRLGLEIPPVAAPRVSRGRFSASRPRKSVRSPRRCCRPSCSASAAGATPGQPEAGPWEVLASYQSKCARRPPPNSGSRARKLSSSSGSIE